MKKIEILIVVDCAGALATTSLISNVYLIDSNQWLGSWDEGTCQLHTVSEDGQFICWRSCAISPDDEVNITGFSGDMIDQKACLPSLLMTHGKAEFRLAGILGVIYIPFLFQ